MRFIWGIVWIVIGLVLIKYAYTLVGFFGHIPWAEQHIGGGGTYTLYKIVGVVVIVLAMLYMFNAIGFIFSPFGSVFGNPQP